MRLGGYEIDVPRALLVVFGVVVVGALVYGGATSVAAFGAFNPAWQGTSDLRGQAADTGADTVVATNTSTYEAYGDDTVAVVVEPEAAYEPAEVRRIEAFLERGGTLFVAARAGSATELLAALGAEARLEGPLLRDERSHYRGPALPEATNVSSHSLTSGVDALTLNHGTAVDAGGATVLVASSEFGYLDRNANDALDEAETMGSYPVATTEPVGDGRVVLVGDGSAFINVMAERPGNRAFARNVFDGSDTVLFDTSHGGDVPPLIAGLLAVRHSPLLQGGLFGLGLLVVFAWQQRLYPQPDERPAGGPSDPGALAASAAGRYPSMERGRLGRLMQGIKAISSIPDDDE